MANFTYEQFESAAKASGLYGQFSQADLNLARQNPDAGMAILQGKTDWASATTDEARALANQRVEQVRSQYGGYTGGSDGSGFYLNPSFQSSFGNTGSSTGSSGYTPMSYVPKAAPSYAAKYDTEAEALMNEIRNREKFSYDPDTDPSYSAYLKQYAREGERAMADTIGSAAAMTGGVPSSYAVTAASQARDYYAAQAADKLPELEQLAYQRYLDDYSMKMSDLSMLRDAEQVQYNRYLNELNQYNTDRSFDYGQLLDQIGYESDQRAEALEKAALAGQYGDYSLLSNLGITADTYDRDFERRYAEAILKAQYGDFSGLEELGIKVDLETMRLMNGGTVTGAKVGDDPLADLTAVYGDTKLIPYDEWDVWAKACAAEGGEEYLIQNGYTMITKAQMDAIENAESPGEKLRLMHEAGFPYTVISSEIDEMVEAGKLSEDEAAAFKEQYNVGG